MCFRQQYVVPPAPYVMLGLCSCTFARMSVLTSLLAALWSWAANLGTYACLGALPSAPGASFRLLLRRWASPPDHDQAAGKETSAWSSCAAYARAQRTGRAHWMLRCYESGLQAWHACYACMAPRCASSISCTCTICMCK